LRRGARAAANGFPRESFDDRSRIFDVSFRCSDETSKSARVSMSHFLGGASICFALSFRVAVIAECRGVRQPDANRPPGQQASPEWRGVNTTWRRNNDLRRKIGDRSIWRD